MRGNLRRETHGKPFDGIVWRLMGYEEGRVDCVRFPCLCGRIGDRLPSPGMACRVYLSTLYRAVLLSYTYAPWCASEQPGHGPPACQRQLAMLELQLGSSIPLQLPRKSKLAAFHLGHDLREGVCEKREARARDYLMMQAYETLLGCVSPMMPVHLAKG